MPHNSEPFTLYEAMAVYFAAKARMFVRVPAFQLRDVGPLRCFHNHPGWPEVDGFYAADGETAPQEVVAAIRAYQPNPEHMITVFTNAPQSVVSYYEALGYEPLPNPQPFMSKSLNKLTEAELSGSAAEISVFRVETNADLAFINSDETVMEADHLHDPLYRYYTVRQNDKPVCWGRCVVVSPEAVYVAGMETAPEYRRRELATALMRQMHADAIDAGARRSVLCSTRMGLGLYEKVGYTTLAQMQAFVPRETRATTRSNFPIMEQR